ncbi:MAG: flippase-like domain-containing protein [Chloroflexi bacterium]|nr:flippase-like domain-containing protein [Chloroflexota bacterium]
MLFGIFLSLSGDPRALLAELTNANPVYIVPAIGVYFVGVWLRAWRWKLLMSPFATVGTWRLFSVILIGFAVNNSLPLRLGELVRTFLLKRSHDVPIASSLATILIERLLDVFALCGLLTLVLLLAPIQGWVLVLAITGASVATAGAVGLLIVAVTPKSLLEALFGFGIGLATRLHPKLGKLAASIVDGLRVLEDGRAVLQIVPLSILCWVAELGLYAFLAESLDLNAGWLGLMAGMVVANLVTVLPSAPGYVGTFDLALQSVLTEAFGVDTVKAVAYTAVTHAALLLPVVVAGLALLTREDLSFRGLARGRVESRKGDPVVSEAAAQGRGSSSSE